MREARVSQVSIEPACPARLAAARLRRACYRPILAPPPIRAIQTWITMESKNGKTNCLELQRKNGIYAKELLAGFDAPIDILLSR
jgi:hypothetical protein